MGRDELSGENRIPLYTETPSPVVSELPTDDERIMAIEGIAPPAPKSVSGAIESLKQRLVDCHRFNYCADAVREVEAACRAAINQAGNYPVIQDWQVEAEKMAELHGSSFVVFRNGESPQCADPTKVIISFTDEGLGYSSAAPRQEVKS